MKRHRVMVWIAANAVGLGVAFVAMIQTGMLFEYGVEFERHWQFVPPPRTLSAYAGGLVSYLVGGLILGAAQAFVLRSQLQRVAPWILATMAGFGLLVAVEWPLLAMDLWGRIPGPVEPIITTVGGCSLAGLLQYQALQRQGIAASGWLIRWVGGLVASLAPTTLLVVSREGVGRAPSWPSEVFLGGICVAGGAALISGRALFAAAAADAVPPRAWAARSPELRAGADPPLA
jgi:hypothetical protein